jgi:BirA family biotin operon repressor/biotin-[acetyl-CoA-carboxylase] ligase
MTDFLARREHFAVVGSTNDVVRAWLANGTPEVCLAIADEQTAGRGRQGRTWTAPPGAALLLSLGFRPTWSDAVNVWRLAAIVSVAMAEAAESVALLPEGTIRLKWPNDLVVESVSGLKKLGGVLGESDGLGTFDPRVVIGLGINTDWPAGTFPPDLAGSITSLREIAGDRHVDRAELAATFVDELGPRIEDLRAPHYMGRFDGAEWAARQATTGHAIYLERGDGSVMVGLASGVDTDTGALKVEDAGRPGVVHSVFVGEVLRVRLADPVTGQV